MSVPALQVDPSGQTPLKHAEKLQKHGMHKGGKRTSDCRAAIRTQLAIDDDGELMEKVDDKNKGGDRQGEQLHWSRR